MPTKLLPINYIDEILVIFSVSHVNRYYAARLFSCLDRFPTRRTLNYRFLLDCPSCIERGQSVHLFNFCNKLNPLLINKLFDEAAPQSKSTPISIIHPPGTQSFQHPDPNYRALLLIVPALLHRTENGFIHEWNNSCAVVGGDGRDDDAFVVG